MSITATVTFNDPRAAFAAYYPLLTLNTVAAAQRWGQYLASNAVLEIEISFTDVSGTGTASARSASSVFIGEWNGLRLFQGAGGHEVATGIDANGSLPDIFIDFAPRHLTDTLWLDPTPEDRSAPPPDRVDGMGTLLHEIGHGLGFTGWRDDFTGQLPPEYASPYDVLVTQMNGFFFFVGENAVAEYGGLVPLTSGNLYHYGNRAPAPGSDLVPDALMNGVASRRGSVRDISALDVAFLADIGLPVLGSAAFPGYEVMAGSAGSDVLRGFAGKDELSGGAGNDTLEGGSEDDVLLGGPGLDTAVFPGGRGEYVVSRSPVAYVVSHNSGTDTDMLADVERLQFADKKVALDLAADQSAGKAVRLIGAAFGADYIPQYISAGIALFDSGLSVLNVAHRALDTPLYLSLAASDSHASFVETVYRNIVGQPPSPAERAYYVGFLQGSGGTMTQAELLAAAANLPSNALNIDLVGLQQSGIEYV
jgi:hypothetical protein